jgi:beta-N-acetylhexosaminidase
MTTDRRLAAGCLMGSFDGTVLPGWLLERVRAGLGGVLLFAQNVVDDAQVADVCAQLHAARADVVVAIDEEGGDVTRLDATRGSDTPTPFAFGVVDDPQLTFDGFADLGHRVRQLGIDLTLAPCADINSNPANPIIGLRSFGVTADVAARHTVAAVTGLRSGGLGACVKHYPGHGDTSADTHIGRAVIHGSMAQMSKRELIPFAAAIDAGVDAVLSAHIVVDEFDAAPVSLSARWTQHLRITMGFDGVIITDALDMDAVADGRGVAGVADAAVAALAAGADLLCLGSNFDAAMTDLVIDAVADALGDGRLNRDDLARSRTRNVALHRAAAAPPRTMSGAAATVARRAISACASTPSGPFAVIECRPRLSMVSFNVAWGLADEVADAGWATSRITSSDAVAQTCDAFLGGVGDLPVLVVVRDLGLHPWQASVVDHCCTARPGAVTVAELGWPAGPVEMWGPPVTTIVTHGAARCSVRALIERLVVKES